MHLFSKCFICKFGFMQTAGTASVQIGLDQWKTFPECIPFECEQYFSSAVLLDIGNELEILE